MGRLEKFKVWLCKDVVKGYRDEVAHKDRVIVQAGAIVKELRLEIDKLKSKITVMEIEREIL